MNGKRIPVPGTERTVWPGSRQADAVSAGSDVLLTAWLRPRSGAGVDSERARTEASLPPLQRTYAERKALEQQTGADPADIEAFRSYCESVGITVGDSHWRSVTV